MSIKIFYDEVNFRIKGWRKLKKILESIALSRNMEAGDLRFIITDDDTVKEINIQFLKHYYYTDVITFDYCDNDIVNGEVYISIDTVKRNAHNYNVSLNEEVRRVIIHGILHLVGYDDKNDIDRDIMRRKEDFWLSEFQN